MENKFKQFITENKWFISFYFIWSFLHLIFYFSGDRYNGDFWPFSDDGLDDYNFIELFVYLVLPIIIFIVWKLVGKDIKKFLDEETNAR
jgi:hypothetical protein